MINRGLTKTSQYVFNSDTGMLEKIDENATTIESLSNQVNKLVNNLEDIASIVNKNEKEPINNIVVITAEDNLIHNYFDNIDISWDASNCLSSAIIKAPKMNVENVNYWATYVGQLTIYAGYNFTFDYVNNNKYTNEQSAVNSLSKYWDNSNIQPFFRGEVSRIREKENEIIIYVDSIGRRFQQKIPDEFREAFIYNQNVRDAFQAICEFLGVKYICPPKTVADNGEETLEDSEGETNNDINDVEDKEKQLASIVKNKVEVLNKKPTSNINTLNNENENTNSTDENLTDNTEIKIPQNGYKDVNFDANGSIVYSSKVIETSPDMAETLLAMEENPLEKYLEDETGIIESVQALLNGDMFEELHNKVMNYDAITIEPKSTTTTDMSTTGTSTSSDTNSENNQQNNNNNNSSQPKATHSLQTRDKNGWINGQYYIHGKIYLSKEYINSLTPSQAGEKRASGMYGTYTADTMQKLLWRSWGMTLH